MLRRIALVTLVPAVLAAALAAQVAPPPARQTQEPVFRTGTRTVPIYVTVTDAEGRLVPDLGPDDFEIYDNGKLQTISIFANEIQPIMVVMMLDRSGSMVDNFRRVQEAGEQFVTRLLPADKARIGSFSYRIQVDPRTFTSDRDELLRILYKELQEPGPTPLWNAVSVGMTALTRQEGRRVVLVFTDGADRPGNDRSTNISLGDLMKRAREEDVMVYGVGLAGRAFGGGFGRRGGGGSGRYPPPPGGGSSAGRTQKPDEGLSKLAAESGGGYFELESTDDLGATFTRVADELHRQYAMGFSPEKLDGKTHKLEVRVKRPGMTARARRSYVATPPRTDRNDRDDRTACDAGASAAANGPPRDGAGHGRPRPRGDGRPRAVRRAARRRGARLVAAARERRDDDGVLHGVRGEAPRRRRLGGLVHPAGRRGQSEDRHRELRVHGRAR